MERTMSVEEKIRRAEEIYAKRQDRAQRGATRVTINRKSKKDVKLLKKMVIQVLISLLIYLLISIIQNSNYIFSKDFLSKIDEILSYDMNFIEIYEDLKKNIEQGIINIKESTQNTEVENNNESIGGADENNIKESNAEENKIEEEKEENTIIQEISQEEKDIQNIKATTTFIKPVQGIISSKYGQRDPTTSTVPKNHTGTDIAASMGTKIIASTSGEVVLASEEGDYGKHLKIQIGEVSIIYAHCNSLYVKQGELIAQGQEIAEVGSTGNSTGPHLHFEIRVSERTVDPEKILEL